ncbi:hypothetical protein VNO77_11367 [Canavalia gladiata]|uniref:Glycosyl transferase family 1 domain-containing protein n=1 Tax=Canavalia gladiata TaxID=3824 RepID=A0AAN9MBX1_CANGL
MHFTTLDIPSAPTALQLNKSVNSKPPMKVLPAKNEKAIATALKADLGILNTAVAGKWLGVIPKEKVSHVLSKVLWWIHEMRGHYFKLEYVKHLPFVAGAMIDSQATAEYRKNRTNGRLGVSCGKGQDLFLCSFHESLQVIWEKKLQLPSLHALVVGSDMNAQTKFERELCKFVFEKKIQDGIHFVNKTLAVAPYLASIDVLVQNSQARGECFGRITIEAMAFHLPVLPLFPFLVAKLIELLLTIGTAAGSTMEIVVNGTTGLLHPVGKEGVTPLANNIVKLATHVEKRLTMEKKG